MMAFPRHIDGAKRPLSALVSGSELASIADGFTELDRLAVSRLSRAREPGGSESFRPRLFSKQLAQ